VLTHDTGDIQILIEVKEKETSISKHLICFHKKFPQAKAIHVIYDIDQQYVCVPIFMIIKSCTKRTGSE